MKADMRERRLGRTMTEGVIWKQLLAFFLPIFFGALFQQLYYITDAIIVGRFAGKEAFGAVDATGNLIKLPLNFFLGISAGASVIISQFYGARDDKKVSLAVQMTAVLTLISGIILSVLGVLLSPAILNAMQTPQDVLPHALDYTRIFFSGMLFSLIYNMGAGVLRAVGDSRRPFHYLIVSCAANVVLDLLFVAVLDWKAAGAAIATVLSQLISAVLVVLSLVRTRGAYRLVLKKLSIDCPMMGDILKTGFPIGIQSSLYPIANIIVQSAINEFGTDAVAAWGVCGKLDFMIWMVMDALNIAISTFVAQNYGARRLDRVRSGVRSCTVMALASIVPLSLLLFIFAEPLGYLFIQDDQVITLSTHLMRWFMTPFYFTYIGGEVLSGAIRGTGESFRPMILTLICSCALRIVWIFTVVPQSRTLDTVIACFPVTWIVTSLAFLVYYKKGKWLKLKDEQI